MDVRGIFHIALLVKIPLYQHSLYSFNIKFKYLSVFVSYQHLCFLSGRCHRLYFSIMEYNLGITDRVRVSETGSRISTITEMSKGRFKKKCKKKFKCISLEGGQIMRLKIVLGMHILLSLFIYFPLP